MDCYPYILIGLLPNLLGAAEFSSLEMEYTANYCLELEAAYGKGMMSEGGAEGIEFMFTDIPLERKNALDIGCGLGGVAFYLAEKYDTNVLGLDVNAWMVAESKQRTSDHLKNKIDFLLSFSNSHWPIPDNSYDLVYSKGVLTHLEQKDEIFQESFRLMKNGGLLVITDWLSSDEKKWGPNIARLLELEHLVLFPESESGYVKALEKNGFTLLSVRDDSQVYLGFNQQIVASLRNPAEHTALLNCFHGASLESSIAGYEAIVNAIASGELRVLRFVAQKNTP